MARILDPAGRSAQQTRNTIGSIPASGLRSVGAGNYRVSDNDGTISCLTTRGAVTLTLPRAAVSSGRQLTVRKEDAGQELVYINVDNNESVGGMTEISLSAEGEFVTMISDGAQWRVMLHF